MQTKANESSKNLVIIINDFAPEFGVALKKLSKTLGRELQGILLIDSEIKASNSYDRDEKSEFKEIICDFSSAKAIEEMLRPIKDNIFLVTCIAERYQNYLMTLIPYIPFLAAPTETSLVWATHKNSMREHLEAYDDSLIPKYRQVTDTSDATIASLVSTLTFPLIVKPTGLASSVLVNKVFNIDELIKELNNGFKRISQIYKRDFGRGTPTMMVEEFIDGDMYSVDAYVNDKGKIFLLPVCKVTTAHSIGLEGFYSFRVDTHHSLSAQETSTAYKATEKGINALKLRSTVTHVELFKSPSGWKIIELGPRAGGYRQELYELAYGIDHAYNEFLNKIGIEPEIVYTPVGYSTAINIYAQSEGTIESINGFDMASKNKSVAWLKQHKKPGDIALFSGNGGIFIVDGVLSNTNINQLNEDVSAVRKCIEIKIKTQSV